MPRTRSAYEDTTTTETGSRVTAQSRVAMNVRAWAAQTAELRSAVTAFARGDDDRFPASVSVARHIFRIQFQFSERSMDCSPKSSQVVQGS